uniref:GIY-YIG endonuclease n=1 Tax=Hypocrea atroviridis TaxID=63577 RepID=A0A6G5UWV4_HYPAT|nr:GIY-YIG endonuclease [Trichoderma atroviride]QEJ82008.1 GIY-YIG endonuclease [Trichoderma atroviride]
MVFLLNIKLWLYDCFNKFWFHGLYLPVFIVRGSRVVSEVPTRIIFLIRWLPADCSKLYIFTEYIIYPSSIIVRSFQHIAIFKGRTKWFNNPPIVNKKTKPNENNITGVIFIDPP